jgi:hypothetical protein
VNGTLHRMQALPAMAKAGLVLGGYLAAAALAFGAVVVHVGMTVDYDASSGMYAFGDLLLFIAVFGATSIVPTGLALFFLRGTRVFWILLAGVALAMAATTLGVTIVSMVAPQSSSLWALLAFPRLFLSPFLAGAFGLASIAAPDRRARLCLLVAAGIECLGALYAFFHWFVPLFFR